MRERYVDAVFVEYLQDFLVHYPFYCIYIIFFALRSDKHCSEDHQQSIDRYFRKEVFVGFLSYFFSNRYMICRMIIRCFSGATASSFSSSL